MITHQHENNPESRQHLRANTKKFSNQCLKVLELLLQGKRLTTMNAPSYGILSLPRRLKDIRDHNGVTNISERWLLDEEGKKVIKQWFIDFKTDKEKSDIKKFIESHRGNIYKSGDKTAAEHASDLIKATQSKLF